jgi:hypothetical protein
MTSQKNNKCLFSLPTKADPPSHDKTDRKDGKRGDEEDGADSEHGLKTGNVNLLGCAIVSGDGQQEDEETAEDASNCHPQASIGT